MLPLRDPTLLPENYSQLSQNTWLYKGAIRGLRVSEPVYTLKRPLTSKQIYRIPLNDNLTDWVNSLWLEFPDPYMKVIRNPTVGDQYNRYYFFPSVDFVQDGSGWFSVPFYAPLANIKAGGPYYVLGIPVPVNTPEVIIPPSTAILPVNAPTTVGSTVLNFASTAGVSIGMEAIDTTDIVISLNTSAGTSIGGDILDFTDTTGVLVGMSIYDVTNPTAIPAGIVVEGVTSTTISLSGLVSSPGVSSGDTIQFSNPAPIVAGTTVTAVTGTTVTLSSPVTGAGVLNNDVISFTVVAEYRSYVYTYVSTFMEEGPPSPPSASVGGNPDGTWTITVYSPSNADRQNRSLGFINIYRTVTDSSGNSTFYQVAEQLPIGIANAPVVFNDSQTDAQIANNLILATTVNTGPPAGLDNVVWMANGILAGVSNDREIWFTAAYQPWAWPASYALTVDFPVVGMSAIGSTLNIITEGQPFIAAGTTPDTMTIGKITANEPGISRGSIFPAGEGVYYASPNGLILLNSSGTINVTQFSMEKEFWESLSPEQWASGRIGLSYTAFVKGATNDSPVGGVILDHLEKNVPCSILQPLIEQGEAMNNLYWDEISGQIFMIHTLNVRWWMPPSGGALYPWLWKSKKFRLPFPAKFKAFMVNFNLDPEVTPPSPLPSPATRNNDQSQVYNSLKQWMIVRIYANGKQVVVREVVMDGEIILIPDGGKQIFWEVQIEGEVYVYMFKMASSVKELRKA